MCLLAGAMTYQSEDHVSPALAIAFALGFVIAHTAGFLFVGIYGDRVARSFKYRFAAAVLLAIPMFTLCTRLTTVFYAEEAQFFIPIFLFSVFLFSAFVWPAWLKSANTAVNEDAPKAARPLP